MNKKMSFILGFSFALLISGCGLFLLVQEVKIHFNSQFITSYTQEISSLTYILNEPDQQRREEIANTELCEAINIVEGAIEDGEFSVTQVELVVSKPISDYKSYISSLEAKFCSKSPIQPLQR